MNIQMIKRAESLLSEFSKDNSDVDRLEILYVITALLEQIQYEQDRNKNNVAMADMRTKELEQALEHTASQPDEGWMGAMECQLIACEALARSDKATALGRG